MCQISKPIFNFFLFFLYIINFYIHCRTNCSNLIHELNKSFFFKYANFYLIKRDVSYNQLKEKELIKSAINSSNIIKSFIKKTLWINEDYIRILNENSSISDCKIKNNINFNELQYDYLLIELDKNVNISPSKDLNAYLFEIIGPNKTSNKSNESKKDKEDLFNIIFISINSSNHYADNCSFTFDFEDPKNNDIKYTSYFQIENLSLALTNNSIFRNQRKDCVLSCLLLKFKTSNCSQSVIYLVCFNHTNIYKRKKPALLNSVNPYINDEKFSEKMIPRSRILSKKKNHTKVEEKEEEEEEEEEVVQTYEIQNNFVLIGGIFIPTFLIIAIFVLIGYLVRRRRRLIFEQQRLQQIFITQEKIKNIMMGFTELNDNELTNYKKEECPICLEEFNVAKKVKISPCNHPFHFECIYEWVSLHLKDSKCPLCNVLLCKESSSNNQIAIQNIHVIPEENKIQVTQKSNKKNYLTLSSSKKSKNGKINFTNNLATKESLIVNTNKSELDQKVIQGTEYSYDFLKKELHKKLEKEQIENAPNLYSNFDEISTKQNIIKHENDHDSKSNVRKT